MKKFKLEIIAIMILLVVICVSYSHGAPMPTQADPENIPALSEIQEKEKQDIWKMGEELETKVDKNIKVTPETIDAHSDLMEYIFEKYGYTPEDFDKSIEILQDTETKSYYIFYQYFIYLKTFPGVFQIDAVFEFVPGDKPVLKEPKSKEPALDADWLWS